MEMSSVYLKGKIFYDFGKYKKAFEHYTIAFDYYADTNKFMAYVISHNIALIKNVLGDQKGAIKILKKNYTEYNQATPEEAKNFSNVFHANTILALCDSYLRLAIDTEDINKKKVYLDSATTYNQIGFKETKRIDDNYGYSLFLAEKGMISSERGEYTKAIEEINIAYKEIIEQNIKDWLPSVFYYKGISYYKLGKEEEAIDLLKKVDSVSQKNATNYPILQKTYYLLGKMYTDRGDQNNIAKYQGLYIKNDQINKHVTKSVIDGIHRNYDIKNLEAQIKKLISSKKEEEANYNAALTIIIILIFLFLIYLVYAKNKQLQNQVKFDKLLRALETKKQVVPIKKGKSKSSLTIDEEQVQKILFELDKFEEKKQFLDVNCSLDFVAKKVKTNKAYLSKVIHSEKQQKFIQYITNLRIDYALEKLKEDKLFRSYDIKSLATELGFKSPDSFSRSFKSKTGIYPSYYIKNINKINTPEGI